MRVFLVGGKLCRVDDEYAHYVDDYSWCLNKGKYNYSWYAICGVRVGKKVKKIYLHRLVSGANPGDRVEFVGSDTLDCRRSNLRLNGKRLS